MQKGKLSKLFKMISLFLVVMLMSGVSALVSSGSSEIEIRPWIWLLLGLFFSLYFVFTDPKESLSLGIGKKDKLYFWKAIGIFTAICAGIWFYDSLEMKERSWLLSCFLSITIIGLLDKNKTLEAKRVQCASIKAQSAAVDRLYIVDGDGNERISLFIENGSNPIIELNDVQDTMVKLGIEGENTGLSFEKRENLIHLGMRKDGMALVMDNFDREAILQVKRNRVELMFSKPMEWPEDYDEEWEKEYDENEGREIIWSAPIKEA